MAISCAYSALDCRDAPTFSNFQTGSERFSLLIHERPSARLGSQVWIEAARRRVFQAYLPTARAAIRALSEQAVDLVYQQAAEAEAERLLFREPDLAPDEL